MVTSLIAVTIGYPALAAILVLAVDPILDMMRTATNVAWQAVVPVLVAAREGLLDRCVHDGPPARVVVGPRRARGPATA